MSERTGGMTAPEGILTLHCVPLLRLRLHRAFGSRAPRLRNTSASRHSLRVSGVRRSASGRMTGSPCSLPSFRPILLQIRSTRKKDLLAKLFCEKERQAFQARCLAQPNTCKRRFAATCLRGKKTRKPSSSGGLTPKQKQYILNKLSKK